VQLLHTIAVCSIEHGAEKILHLWNIQQMSAIEQWELFIDTYTCKINANNQLHNCVCGELCIKMVVLKIYLQNNCGKERSSPNCFDDLYRNAKVNYSKPISKNFLHSKQHRQLLNSEDYF